MALTTKQKLDADPWLAYLVDERIPYSAKLSASFEATEEWPMLHMSLYIPPKRQHSKVTFDADD